MTMRTIQR